MLFEFVFFDDEIVLSFCFYWLVGGIYRIYIGSGIEILYEFWVEFFWCFLGIWGWLCFDDLRVGIKFNN